MLAQNFKTAADLRISEVELDALIKVLGMLERGEIDDSHFDMTDYLSECGTIGCICGWAHIVSNKNAFPDLVVGGTRENKGLDGLFYMIDEDGSLSEVRVASAAIALRSYLTTGEPNWAEALSV